MVGTDVGVMGQAAGGGDPHCPRVSRCQHILPSPPPCHNLLSLLVHWLCRHLRPLAEEAAIIRRMIEAWLDRYGDSVDDVDGRLKLSKILLATSFPICTLACHLLQALDPVLMPRLHFWTAFAGNDIPDTCRLAARVAQVMLKHCRTTTQMFFGRSGHMS
jgi:hypothetical protein